MWQSTTHNCITYKPNDPTISYLGYMCNLIIMLCKLTLWAQLYCHYRNVSIINPVHQSHQHRIKGEFITSIRNSTHQCSHMWYSRITWIMIWMCSKEIQGNVILTCLFPTWSTLNRSEIKPQYQNQSVNKPKTLFLQKISLNIINRNNQICRYHKKHQNTNSHKN